MGLIGEKRPLGRDSAGDYQPSRFPHSSALSRPSPKGETSGREGQLLWRWLAPLVPLLLWLLVGCAVTPAPLPEVTATPAPEAVRIGVVAGAQAIVELVERPFANFAPQVDLQLVVGSEAELTAALGAGELDGLLTYAPPANESNWTNPVAWDGLVLLVNRSNPVTALTLGEARALFVGQATSWDGVGGAAESVSLIVLPDEAAATRLLQARLLAGLPLAVGAQVVSGQGVAMELVAEEETAVAYGMLSGIESETNLLALNGVLPASETLGNQHYPLAVPLYFVHGEATEPRGGVRDFVAWLQSEQGQVIVAEQFGRVREPEK